MSQNCRSILDLCRPTASFIAYMVANALKHRPPLGLLRNFVISGGDHAKSLDIKLHGMRPIIDLARVYALSAGQPVIDTLERLAEAAEPRP